jgi:hypothetical protein
MVVDLKWVAEKRTVGRDIYLNDRRRAVQLSDESVGVMCMDASADGVVSSSPNPPRDREPYPSATVTVY